MSKRATASPELPERSPLSLKEAERVRALVERMEGAKRLVLHAMVVPNAPAIDPLKFMEEAVARYAIKAWKSYTQWGPQGVGWELDDRVALQDGRGVGGDGVQSGGELGEAISMLGPDERLQP